jgi:hypothetical protein
MPASKLTPARTRKIIALISEGSTIEVACAACGISARTYRRWAATPNDASTDNRYAAFAAAAEIARAEAEAKAVRMIRTSGREDWRAWAWYLERSHPDRWGRQTKTELSGPGGRPLMISLKDLHAAAADVAELTEAGRDSVSELERLMDLADDDAAARKAETKHAPAAR